GGLVDVLAAGPARAVGVDPQLVLVELDGLVLGEQRTDDHLRERGVAAVRLVERREADEPVDAALGLKDAVGVLPLDGESGGFQSRLLARARLDQLNLEPAGGRPT